MEAAILAMGEDTTPTNEVSELRDLYERHAESVYRTALRVTGNPADAEDVLQTVFLRVLDAGQQLDRSRAPGAYLRRAAANAAVDVLRRRSVRGESSVPTELAEAAAGRESAASPDDAMLRERLRRALATLTPERAELFVLFHLEGYRYEELAELLGLEPGTVGSRLHRIRTALQEALGI